MVRIGVAALLGSWLAVAGGVDGYIDLQVGALTDEEWPDVKLYLDAEWPNIEQYLIFSEEAADPLAAGALIRERILYAGRYDIDGDGADELFVYIGFGCGNLGCPTVAFRRQSAGWRPWMSLTVADSAALCVTAERRGGHADLYSYAQALWWDGTEYRRLCLRRCDPADNRLAPGPRDLAVRQRLLDRSCAE